MIMQSSCQYHQRGGLLWLDDKQAWEFDVKDQEQDKEDVEQAGTLSWILTMKI